MIADIAFYGLLVAVIVAHIFINRQAGNSYPTPWPDEAHFLWQAHSVATDNTLFSEELNTDRTIMWQPPGYLIFVGTIFKVVGTSLESGRLISLFLLIGAFLVLIKLLTHYGHRWPILILSSLFFLNSRFIACGNVARMEALLLLIILSGFLLIQRGRSFLGLALLAITPVIHFNGLYFCVFGLGLVIFRGELLTLWRPFTREKIAALVIVVAVWLGYAALIAANRNSFILDMRFQFGRKLGRETFPFFIKTENLQMYLFLLVGFALALKAKIKAVELLFLGVTCWLIFPLGGEMWYEVFQHLWFLIIAVFILHLWFYINPIKGSLIRRAGQVGLGLILMLLLIGWNYRSGRIVNMFDYYNSLDFYSLGIKGEKAYLIPDDQTQLAGILDSLVTEKGSLLVEFEPHGDAFYFLDLEEKGVKFSCPLFQSRKPDLQIVHFSRHLPSRWEFGDKALTRMGYTRDSTKQILYQRDQTEKFYFVGKSQ